MLIEKDLYSKIREVIPTLCVDMVVTNWRNEFLLIKRTQSPAKGQWWLPGGRVFKNETLQQAVLRKAREEIGVDVTFRNFISVEETIFKKDNVHTVNAVFHVTYYGTDINLDETHSTYVWEKEIDESLHFAVKNPIKKVMERL